MRKTLRESLGIRLAYSIRQAQNGDLAEVLATHHWEYERAINETKASLAERYGIADMHSRCVDLAPPFFERLLLTCKVGSVEGISTGTVAQRQVWAGPAVIDAGMPPLDVIAILETSGPSGHPETPETGAFRVIGWVALYAASIGKPFMVEGDGGRAYLTIPTTANGSAGASDDVVMARQDAAGPWREIDASSWAKDLEHRIPRGLYPKMAYSLDLLTMRAITDIARDDDPKCCPSGGKAEVSLALRDDVLVIDGLVLRRPPQTAPKVPPHL